MDAVFLDLDTCKLVYTTPVFLDNYCVGSCKNTFVPDCQSNTEILFLGHLVIQVPNKSLFCYLHTIFCRSKSDLSYKFI